MLNKYTARHICSTFHIISLEHYSLDIMCEMSSVHTMAWLFISDYNQTFHCENIMLLVMQYYENKKISVNFNDT